ncbi:MAG: D-cysteine desulfhydrase family protein [Candidatus Marinimicrobia bacterium]|nr:D-cysteine desulfhydrase family protein [Candidatus Neomarinimicrobiota bacterium]
MNKKILENRIELFGPPSPLQRLKNIEKIFPGNQIYIKRDDLSLIGMGGNKLRKLEYLVYDAINQGYDTLITAGAPQSNHCRQTAAAAATQGLECHLVLGGESPAIENGNILLDRLLGATLHMCAKEKRNASMETLAKKLKTEGKKPYIIPIGGSNAIGALGYVRAGLEIAEQIKELAIPSPVHLVLATSSGGTHSGLHFASQLMTQPFHIRGIRIDKDDGKIADYEKELAGICRGLSNMLGKNIDFHPDDFNVNYMYNHEEYGNLGLKEKAAIKLLAREEGLILDPVYTGRAFAGLLGELEKGQFEKGDSIIFLHSGGAPAIFAYADGF